MDELRSKYLSKELLTLIQTLETEIKKLIVVGVMNQKPGNELQAAIYAIINKRTKDLTVYNKDRFILGLKLSAKKWYQEFNSRLSALNLAIMTPKTEGKPPIEILKRVAFYKQKGVPHIDEYERQVKQAVRGIAEQTAKYPSVKKYNGEYEKHTLSLRNLAEMSVRYEKNMGDLEALRRKGVKLVWISSHADASERCEPWQGKLYSLDGTSGVEDGINYQPIENALRGSKLDGNGCISGYNCRHHLKEYEQGVKGPYEYRTGIVAKERAIDNRQRALERKIVKLRTEALLIRDVDHDESNRLRDKAADMYKDYVEFSQTNERAFYPWRTQIVRYEKHE